jgi:ribosomal protein S27E
MEIKKCKGSLEIKRMYLPAKVQVKCHHCENILTYDFDEQYLSYPSIGVPEQCDVYCRDCENETFFNVTLEVTLHCDTINTRGE